MAIPISIQIQLSPTRQLLATLVFFVKVKVIPIVSPCCYRSAKWTRLSARVSRIACKDTARPNSRKVTTSIQTESGTMKIQAGDILKILHWSSVFVGRCHPPPPVLLCNIPTRGFGRACPGGGQGNSRVDFVAV